MRHRPVTAPMIGKILYRPVLLISWPLGIEAEKMPTIIGSSARPDWVGDMSLTACR